jgi:hypothetical protein
MLRLSPDGPATPANLSCLLNTNYSERVGYHKITTILECVHVIKIIKEWKMQSPLRYQEWKRITTMPDTMFFSERERLPKFTASCKD